MYICMSVYIKYMYIHIYISIRICWFCSTLISVRVFRMLLVQSFGNSCLLIECRAS